MQSLSQPGAMKCPFLKAQQTGIQTLSPQQLIQRFAEPDQGSAPVAFLDFDKFGFHRIEHARHLMGQPLPPHRKTFHDFCLVTKGAIHRGKGMDYHMVPANSFCFIPAHTITFNATGSDDVEGFVCHFDNEIISLEHHPFMQSMSFLQFDGCPVVHIPAEQMPIMVQLLQRIEAEAAGNLPDKFRLIQSYLITLFLEVNRFAQPKESTAPSTSYNITERFKKLLHQHIQEKQHIGDYADLLCITPNHLNKCVKQTTNRTASEWIDEMLILQSKVLLSQTALTIAEVAHQVGMDDQGYFGRFFKKKIGLTPSDYRKQFAFQLAEPVAS
jgi:AraC-like DNA-binding protein